MAKVERKGDSATCGHTNSGSTNVLVNGKGCSRVNKDSAGGLIVGPGNSNVLVNGFPISLEGDNIKNHGPGAHSSPTTSSPSTNVFSG